MTYRVEVLVHDLRHIYVDADDETMAMAKALMAYEEQCDIINIERRPPDDPRFDIFGFGEDDK